MATFLAPSASSLSSMNCSFLSAATAARSRRSSIGFCCPQVVSPGQVPAIIAPSDDYDQDLAYNKHVDNVASVRKMLSKGSDRLQAMVTADSLKRLCIDHHFSEEIDSLVSSMYDSHEVSLDDNCDLFDVTLSFKLLREGGYGISSDMLQRFINKNGEFKPSLSKDIKGLLSLHDASYLNMGEEILYKANEFSTKKLKSSMNYLGPNLAKFVRQALEHPYHLSLQQYKARHHLTYLQRSFRRNYAIEELAMTEFQLNKLLHQNELQKVTIWWRDLGLAQEIPSARDQVQKWYMWSMTILQGPAFSKYRLEITKVISFIYIVDDIFDLMGSPEELSLFTEAVNRWDITATNSLPSCMRSCYMALYTITNEIAEMVESEHGFNPIYYFRKVWEMLFKAFMVEAKWFAAQHVPAADDYLRNGAVSSGVHVVLVHLFFLLGQGVTKDAMELIEHNPPIISSSAKILRLWDDLGSAEDEGQEGFDGSYTECHMKEHPWCSSHSAKEHVMGLISDAWEELNIECFSRRSFSPRFIQASLNCARMVRVMYAYDEEQNLPILKEYINMLLL